jgi:pectate lyase
MALRPLTAFPRLIPYCLALTVALAACAQSDDGGTEQTGSGGANGAAGTKGSGGTSAPGGSPGEAGTNGAAGTNGRAGTNGSTGVAGTTGTTGLAGTTGTTGVAGTNGAAGTTGKAGTTGTTGVAGTNGAAGTTGKAGTTGAAGTNGKAGTTGAAGTNGAAGTTGKAGTTGAAGTNGAAGTTGAAGNTGSSDKLIGWAAAGCTVSGVSTTTGGGNATPVAVTSASAFTSNISGTGAKVIQVSGSISGNFNIGSNKTIIGLSGAKITGNLTMNGSANVILQNLTIVGLNCSDVPSNGDCQDGEDAITVEHSAHHIWIDHLDISDGSDGNLDITDLSDCVTVSWTKLHYSANRASGYTGEVHHFSDLIGASDSDTDDAGHLRVTWHHDWWATNVVERMPRVRFGDVHVFNSLYTATGDDHCVEVGDSANILMENNVFVGVKDPIDSTDYSNSASIVVSKGNVYTSTSGQTANKGSTAFTPGYTYTLDAASSVESEVESGAGPK